MPEGDGDIIGIRFGLPEEAVVSDASQEALQAPPVVFEQIDQDLVGVHGLIIAQGRGEFTG